MILGARERIIDRFFQSCGPIPLIGRTAAAVAADLIHGGVDLDLIAIRIVEFEAGISTRSAPPFIEDCNALGLQKFADLEKLGSG